MCEQNTSHVTFSRCFCTLISMSHMTLAQGSRCVARTSSHVSSAWCCRLDTLRLSTLYSSPSLSSSTSSSSTSMWVGSRRNTCALSQMRSLTLLSTQPLSQVMSPTSSTTTTSQRPLKFFVQESSSDSRPSYLHDLEIDDDTIGRALSSPLFTQEREEPAGRRQAYHSPDESLLSSQSLSVGHVRTGKPVSDQFDSLIPNVRENPCRDSENEQIRILLERQKRADSR